MELKGGVRYKRNDSKKKVFDGRGLGRKAVRRQPRLCQPLDTWQFARKSWAQAGFKRRTPDTSDHAITRSRKTTQPVTQGTSRYHSGWHHQFSEFRIPEHIMSSIPKSPNLVIKAVF